MNHEIPENHEKVRCAGGGGFSHSTTLMIKPVAFFRVGG